MYSFSASIAAIVSSEGRSIVSVAETEYKNKTRLVHQLKVLLKTKTRQHMLSVSALPSNNLHGF